MKHEALKQNSKKGQTSKSVPCFMLHVSSRAGFTLIEMLVSISIFMVVMTVAAGSMVSIMDGNRKAQAIKSVMDNLSFALEGISKSARTGSGFSVSGSLPSNSFSYTDYKKNVISLSLGAVSDSLCPNGIKRVKVPVAGGTISECLTAKEVKLDTLGFSLADGDLVTIILNGTAGTKDKIKTPFFLQTSVARIGF